MLVLSRPITPGCLQESTLLDLEIKCGIVQVSAVENGFLTYVTAILPGHDYVILCKRPGCAAGVIPGAVLIIKNLRYCKASRHSVTDSFWRHNATSGL